MKMLHTAAVATAALLTAPLAIAEEQTFDFADPKGVNGITFILDSQLEPFVGIGGGVTGTVTMDPENPASFAGSISVATGELKLISDRMTSVMQGADWLNIGDNSDITVAFGEVLDADDDDEHEHGQADDDEHEDHGDHEDGDDDEDGTTLHVQGTLTFGGISIDKTFEIHATYIPDGGTQRGGGQGDLLVLRSEFTVSRYDLGISPDTGTEKVSEDVWVIVPIVGYSK